MVKRAIPSLDSHSISPPCSAMICRLMASPKPVPSPPLVVKKGSKIRPSVWDDIIAVNLDHYRLNADYKHGMHYTALPTAWVAGFDKEATLKIANVAGSKVEDTTYWAK